MLKRLRGVVSFMIVAAALLSAAPAHAVYLCNPDNTPDPDVAIQACNVEIAAGRSLAIAYYDRGLAWAKKNETDKALADYNASLKINPDYQNAYISRGNALKLKNRPDDAIADYNKAISLDPPKAGLAYYNRGNSWRDKNENDKAISDYTQAISLMPQYVNAYVARGNIYKTLTNYDLAMADYDKALSINSSSGLAYYNRGVTWRKKSESDKAIADYNQYISLTPKDPDGYVARGNIYSDKKDYTTAIADYDRALAIDPNNALAKSNRANAVARQQAVASAPPEPQPVISTPSVTSNAGRRVALVIGNSQYKNVPALPNPQRDAALLANTLRKVGFQTVTLQTNLGRDGMMNALRDFAQQAVDADWAMIYYAGHGMEIAGTNYLLPIDAKIAVDSDINFEGISLDLVRNVVNRAKRLRLIVLDACRDNPFANQMKRSLTVASRSVSRGLASVEPEAGTLIVYAAKDGETAADGSGNNSPFAAALVKNMQTPGLEVRRLFDYVRDDVMDATAQKQQPFSYGSLSGRQDFYFVAAK
ncbi:MAG: tetratricopeptide repeat protein [Afipia sp.]|nr:tetratricopeptide repeat protein [Afipia sp.]